MSTAESQFENEVFITAMDPSGICITRVKANSFITISHAKENTQHIKSYGEAMPLLVDSRNINSITKEARDHFAMRGRSPGVTAIAILIASPVSRLIGNFYMGLNKPVVPTKLFTEEDKAMRWLGKFL